MRYSIITLLLLSFLSAQSQVWIGANPVGVNPSFTGSANAPRVNLYIPVLHTQFESLENKISSSSISSHFSFDTFVPKLSTGIGITAFYGLGTSSHFAKGNQAGVSVIAAPKISIKGKYTLSPSIEYSNMDFERKVFAENWGPKDTYITSANIYSLRSGLLFNTKKFYAGISIDILAQQKGITATDIEKRAKRGLSISSIQAGYTHQTSDDSKFSFTPQVWIGRRSAIYNLFEYDGYNYRLNLGLRYKKFLFGPGIGSTDIYKNALHLMVGFQKNSWRVMYIHESPTLNFTPRIGKQFLYIGSLSVRFVFSKTQQPF